MIHQFPYHPLLLFQRTIKRESSSSTSWSWQTRSSSTTTNASKRSSCGTWTLPATSTTMIPIGCISYGEWKRFLTLSTLINSFCCSYEKYKNKNGNWCYASVGYTTIYKYFAYPNKTRARVSQMLILPPFQRLGIGTKMLEVSPVLIKESIAFIILSLPPPSDNLSPIQGR